MNIKMEQIRTNGIQLHTALAGPDNGEPVLLLHGFPEPWFGWENQIHTLAEAGFRVVAPDQRGYNLSSKPKGIDNYRMDLLIEDIIGLARGTAHQRAAAVGCSVDRTDPSLRGAGAVRGRVGAAGKRGVRDADVFAVGRERQRQCESEAGKRNAGPTG